MHEVDIPHLHAVEGEDKTFPVYVQMPAAASNESPAPCIIIFTGLDGYRTELALWRGIFIPKGCGLIVVEIPGTGDSPALKQDPKSPDRQWSSLLDWTETQASIDHKKLVVWGFSTGGYYSIRIAHTHADRLKGAVSLGGGCHHMFDPEWLSEVDHLEYPFEYVKFGKTETRFQVAVADMLSVASLAGALAYKFGYSDVEAFKKEARAKFSLLEAGILDMPCTRLLLVNVSWIRSFDTPINIYTAAPLAYTTHQLQGTDDEIYPIDDYKLALNYGGPKEARYELLCPLSKHKPTQNKNTHTSRFPVSSPA
jgi:pimeloyl-ACP methyl ester carboxylesterase